MSTRQEKEWQGVKWAEMGLKQQKIPTMDKPLIITVCPSGALIARRQNPDQPYAPREIAAKLSRLMKRVPLWSISIIEMN